MKTYYVRLLSSSSGFHEVHTLNCKLLPGFLTRQYLGQFSDCKPALRAATKFFTNVRACSHCCAQCHA